MLDPNKRAELGGILQKMTAAGESEANIQAVADHFNQKYGSPEQPSALSRFGSALMDSVPIPHDLQSAIDPVGSAATSILRGSVDSYQRARGQGAGMPAALAAGIPVLGPAASQIGEEVGGGDYASAAGHAIPLLAPFIAEGAAGALGRAVEPVGAVTRTGASVAKDAALGAVKSGASEGFNALLEGKGFSGGAAHALKGVAKGGFEAGKAAFEARKALAKVAEEHPIIAEKLAPVIEQTTASSSAPVVLRAEQAAQPPIRLVPSPASASEVAPAAIAEKAPAVAKVETPKKLTVRQKNAALKDQGWPVAEIKKLKPAEVEDVIAKGETWPPGSPGKSAGIGKPATGRTAYGYSSKSPNERFAIDNTPHAKIPTDEVPLANLLKESVENPEKWKPKSIKTEAAQAGVQDIKSEILKMRKDGHSRVKIANSIAQKYGLPASETNFVVADFLKASGQ